MGIKTKSTLITVGKDAQPAQGATGGTRGMQRAQAECLDRMNKKHAVVREGGKTVIITEEFDPVLERRYLARSSFTDIRNFYHLPMQVDEEETIAEGQWWLIPVVSVSIGDTARFLFGGLQRHDEVATIPLESGDAFVFGGPARLRYHGVSKIIRDTAPRELQLTGRFNLTFRQSEVPALIVDEDLTRSSIRRDLPYSRKPGGIRMTPEAWENFDSHKACLPLPDGLSPERRAWLNRQKEEAKLARTKEPTHKPYPTKKEQQKQARERFDRMMSGEKPGWRGKQ